MRLRGLRQIDGPMILAERDAATRQPAAQFPRRGIGIDPESLGLSLMAHDASVA
jgi:hypothetical protein